MDRLVRLTLAVREAFRSGFALSAALALGAVVVSDAGSPLETSWFGAAVVAWSAILVALVTRRWRKRAGRLDSWSDLELGVLLVVGVFGVLLRADGGLSGPLYPVVYVLVALVCTFAR